MTGKFLTDLDVTNISDSGSGLWRLDDNLEYCTSDGQIIIAPRDIIVDFASTGSLRFIPILYALIGNTAQKAATLHDYLYRKNAMPEVTRERADWIFYDAMLTSGVPGWRAWMMHRGVRIGGGGSWQKHGVWDTDIQQDG